MLSKNFFKAALFSAGAARSMAFLYYTTIEKLSNRATCIRLFGFFVKVEQRKNFVREEVLPGHRILNSYYF